LRCICSFFTTDIDLQTDTLDKTKVTGIEPVDKAQDGVNNLVGGQLGKGGALQGVGDTFSKEGINRSERGGKDESVSHLTSIIHANITIF
jgi:hypothetical protein